MKKQWKQPVFDSDGWAYREITEAGYFGPYGWRCQYPENLQLGEDTDIGCFTYINAKYGVVIEADVKIGANCSIYSESTIDNKKGPVHIGIGARIGAHSVIMPGVTIGSCNAVIAACSFVNRDVSGGELVGGVPIQCVKELHNSNAFEDITVYNVRCLDCDTLLECVDRSFVRGKDERTYRCSTCEYKFRIREGNWGGERKGRYPKNMRWITINKKELK